MEQIWIKARELANLYVALCDHNLPLGQSTWHISGLEDFIMIQLQRLDLGLATAFEDIVDDCWDRSKEAHSRHTFTYDAACAQRGYDATYGVNNAKNTHLLQHINIALMTQKARERAGVACDLPKFSEIICANRQ
jgi:hypothetical protein